MPGQEVPLEKEMATHSVAWEIPQTEEPGGLQSMWSQKSQTKKKESDTTQRLNNNSNQQIMVFHRLLNQNKESRNIFTYCCC